MNGTNWSIAECLLFVPSWVDFVKIQLYEWPKQRMKTNQRITFFLCSHVQANTRNTTLISEGNSTHTQATSSAMTGDDVNVSVHVKRLFFWPLDSTENSACFAMHTKTKVSSWMSQVLHSCFEKKWVSSRISIKLLFWIPKGKSWELPAGNTWDCNILQETDGTACEMLDNQFVDQLLCCALFMLETKFQ